MFLVVRSSSQVTSDKVCGQGPSRQLSSQVDASKRLVIMLPESQPSAPLLHYVLP